MAKLDVLVDVQTKGTDKLNGLAKGFASTAINVAKVGLPIAGAIAGVTALAAEAEKSDAKLGQVFKTMKAGAFTTIPALNKQAEAIGQLSSFDDEGIKEAQATLLTFGNVTGDAFDKGLQASVDMAEFLGTDLQSATIQMGKALNDPVKGITALSKAGVSFSEEQKEMIKKLVETGKAGEAQNIILGEMQKQFGGAAEALSETSAGQAAQAFEDLTNAGEELGAIFLPILAALARGVSEFAHFVQDNIGTIKPILEGIGEVIGQVFGFISTTIGGFVSGGSGGAFAGIFQHIGEVVDFVSKNVFPFLLQMFNKVVAFIRENGPTIGSIVSQAFGAIVAVAKVVVPILMNIAKVVFPILLTAAGILLKGLDGTFKLIGGVFEVAGKVVSVMVKSITTAWLLLSTITTAIWTGITNTIKGVFNAVADVINGFFGFLNGLSFGIGPFDVGPVHIDAATFDPFNIPLIPHLAQGGIISSPTLALLGEAGPEAVVPLGSGGKLGGDVHYHVDVRGEEPFIRNETDLTRTLQRTAFLAGF
jgi:phage-related protein